MGNIPKSRVLKKQDRIDSIVENLVGYMELEKSALAKLQKEKRGQPLLHLKLQMESNFALQLLRNLFRIDISYLKAIIDAIHQDPDFEKGVKKFVDGLVPEAHLLLTLDDVVRKKGKFELLGG